MSEIADHCALSIRVSVPPLSFERLPRKIWSFSEANWVLLKARLRSQDWQWISNCNSGLANSICHKRLREYFCFVPAFINPRPV
eukprot:8515500-Pyramimonas_sp.AAC.1